LLSLEGVSLDVFGLLTNFLEIEELDPAIEVLFVSLFVPIV
jgi:hypothetical protein